MSRESFDAKQEEELKKRLRCQLCDGNNVTKYKKIRDDTQEIEYLVHCPDCGFQGDMFHINDLVYYWSKLPSRRVFERYQDNREDGGTIKKISIDHDAKWDDPNRVKEI